MKCLVTGACGFIGINLTEDLLKKGHEVIGVDNFIVGKLDELYNTCGHFEKFKFKFFDFSRRYSDESMFDDIDVIYHLGGMSGVRESVARPDVWFVNNVVGTFNILEIARKYDIKNVVIASSGSAVGEADPPIHEELPTKPLSPYGASKGCKELFTFAYYYSYGMNVSALRFSNVYGPHSTIKISLVGKFIRKILKGESINIYGDGEQTRDFIYVKDLINAVQASGEKNIGGEVFQVCTGTEVSVNEITKMICDKMRSIGYEIPEINNTDPAIGDVKTNYADNTKAKTMLDWRPQVNLHDGLEETIRWFIEDAPM